MSFNTKMAGPVTGVLLAMSASSVQAAAVSYFGGAVDWSNLVAGGVTITATTINNDPWSPGATVGTGLSDAGVEIEGAEVAFQESLTGNNVTADYAGGGYQAGASFIDGVITASAESDRQTPGAGWASAYAFRGDFFVADATGAVSFTVPYTVDVNLSTDNAHDSSWAGGGFDIYFSLLNWNDFVDALPAIPIGQVTEQQEDDAFALAMIGEDWRIDEDKYWNSSACDPVLNPCDGLTTLNDSGVLSINGNLTAGETYLLFAEVSTWAYTDVQMNAVPVPAAVWLFGSGLLGLAGLARRGK